MAYRDDINDLMKSEVQRFREERLTDQEQVQIEKDVMAFCIIEIRKFCGEEVLKDSSRLPKGKYKINLERKKS